MVFQLIKRIGGMLINSWQRTKQTKRPQVTTKTLDSQITPTSRLIAHKLPQKGTENINEKVSISEQGAVVLKKDEITEAIRISDSKGQSIAADTHSDGSIGFSIQGKSRQGEAGNTEISQILVNHLNRDGANWGKPIDVATIPGRREEGIDCEARDGKKVLKIQVTRAERDPKLWEKLNTLNEVSGNETFEELADALKAAIQAKANKLSSQQRKELILALDATDTPGYAFQPVIDSFHDSYANWAVKLGFEGIWIVGPNETLTSRLDEHVPS
jgi:hypothetical protein